MDGVIELVVVILAGLGMVYYRLGKLTSTVKEQGKDIVELKKLVLNGNPGPGKRGSRKRKKEEGS